jgi:hypothetical protein
MKLNYGGRYCILEGLASKDIRHYQPCEKEKQVMAAIGICASSGKHTVYRGELRARCEAQGGGRDCRLFNLTPHRAFVESFIPHVTGTRVTLRFDLPNGHQVCTGGVVSNHNFAEGFDVDFTDLSAADREQILGLIG